MSKRFLPLRNVADVGSKATVDDIGVAAGNLVEGSMWTDYLSATAAADEVYAYGGDDWFHFLTLADAAGDYVDGGVGVDNIQFNFAGAARGVSFTVADSVAPITLYGATIVNFEEYTLLGSAHADAFVGGIWDDRFEGRGGNDRLSGGLGDDELFGGDGDDALSGGNGDDAMMGEAGHDTLRAGNGRDWLGGDAGNDKLYGDAGDDTIYGGADNDLIEGGAGNDTIQGDEGNDTLSGGDGDDTLRGGAGVDSIDGGAGSDVIERSTWQDRDSIDGGGGVDRLILHGFSGTFVAKAAHLSNSFADGTRIIGIEAYTIEGSAVRDVIYGHDGDDVFSGYDGNDALRGNNGNDLLDGGLGVDALNGGAGDDLLIVGGGGQDTVVGGTGIDTAKVDRFGYSDAIDYVFTVTGTSATLSDGSTFTDIEVFEIRTAYGDDVLTAGTARRVVFDAAGGNNRLTGSNGDDVLTTGSGNDTVIGGRGNDLIIDGGGTNSINAGDGNDEVRVETHGAGRTNVVLGTGDDWVLINNAGGGAAGVFAVSGGDGFDYAWINRYDSRKDLTFTVGASATLVNGDITLTSIERVHIRSGFGNDRLTGGALDDWFNGSDGSDTLKGLGGDDELTGWYGQDVLEGGDGNDILWATGGFSDGVQDRLDGGSGDDEIHMNRGDHAVGGAGTDRIFLDLGEESTGVSFAFSTGTTRVDATTSFASSESLWLKGTWGGDSVTGGAMADVLEGKAGSDVLRGGSGNDELHDGDGNDALYGDLGDDLFVRDDYDANGTDLFDGGGGYDTLRFNIVNNEAVILDMVEQQYNNGQAWGLTVKAIENVVGTDRPDDIRGSASRNIFWGGDGADVLDGRQGDDTLIGGKGGDVLVGGAGRDRFEYGADAIGSGDFIVDFTRGEDKIAIDRAGFGLAPDYAFSLVVGADPKATSAAAQFLFESDSGRLWFDADGKGTGHDAKLVATIHGLNGLASSDFLFF